MKNILISACLLGEPVRYDGAAKPMGHPLIDLWNAEGRLIPFCPEVEGGLSTPRPPAEINGAGGGDGVLDGTARIATHDTDVTQAFIFGARAALALARKARVSFALLKERSPSCGTTLIYDGSFTGNRIPGMGVTAALLRRHGILVFSENGIDCLGKCIKS